MVEYVVLGLFAEQKEPDLEDEKLELPAQILDSLSLVDADPCETLDAKLFILFEKRVRGLARLSHRARVSLIEQEPHTEPELRRV